MDVLGPMSPSGKTVSSSPRVSTDGPPPLPAEAKRKAPNYLARQDSNDKGLGSAGSDPLVQSMDAIQQINMGIQKLAAVNPLAGSQVNGLGQAFIQQLTQMLATSTSPGPPQQGMAPPMPMPPMGMPPPQPNAPAPPAVGQGM